MYQFCWTVKLRHWLFGLRSFETSGNKHPVTQRHMKKEPITHYAAAKILKLTCGRC
jgi:hypothetical protein